MESETVKIFFSFVPNDRDFYNLIRQQLGLLERDGRICCWSDEDVLPGAEPEREMKRLLDSAAIIVPLISPEYLATQEQYRELKRAMERKLANEAHVVPVLLRPCNYRSAPCASLKPANSLPLSEQSKLYETLNEIAVGIELVVSQRSLAQPTSPGVAMEIIPQEIRKVVNPPAPQSWTPIPPPRPPEQKSVQDPRSRPRFAAYLVAALVLILGGTLAFALFDPSFHKPPPPTPTSTPSPVASTPTVPSLPPGPVLVQNARVSSSASTNTVTFSQSVKPGNFLIVAITQYERQISSLASGVKDNQNDVYHLIANKIATPDQDPANDQDYVELYSASDARGGVTTVSVTFSNPADSDSGDTNIGIYEFSGLNTVDNVLSNTSSTVFSKSLPPDTLSAGPLKTTGSDDVCFAVGVDSGPLDQNVNDDSAISPGTSYTVPPDDWQEDWNGGERFYTEYDAAVAPGGCNPNFKIHYTATWAIISAAFKNN